MTNNSNFKIIKQTNPLGGITFIAKVKLKFLFFIPMWFSIMYTRHNKEVDTRGYDVRYNTIEEAQEAIDKYRESIKKKTKTETIPYK